MPEDENHTQSPAGLAEPVDHVDTAGAPKRQGEPQEAGVHTQAALVVGFACIGCVVTQAVLGLLFGVDPRVAMAAGAVVGFIAGACCLGPMVIAPITATDRRRREMIARIERIARTDREELFEDLLTCSSDPALGPLAQALHSALTRAHADRLEAAALRREMAHRVERETGKRTRSLEHAAERDELTGLTNRRGFDRRLEELIAHAKETSTELALVALDMDRFKNLNDTCGHEKGDEALIIAGELLMAHTREGDLAARIGGDELFLVLAGADAERCSHVCARISDLFARHPAGSGIPWPGMSFGVSFWHADKAQDTAHLKRMADEALYASKANGRGTVTFARAA